MHKKFNHKEFEQKWQSFWESKNTYQTSESNKPKAFVLDMFPYPSGEGLHVGHPKGYIATDIYSRFKRMNGFEVLHPMGWDAFGLPAENYAIKNKVHPEQAVTKNVKRFKEQLSILGFDYDWDREINTTDPNFYKWTQWVFIQLWKKGLAYESNEPINWCPGCQTGLANEDLEADGTCERCSSIVEKKPMRQWVLKIRDYADRMLEDLDTLKWPEHIKEAQRNWIGRSKGAEIDFKLSTPRTSDVLGVVGGGGMREVTVFTTRPDTLFGATYLVLAPEHPLLQDEQVRGEVLNLVDVDAYIATAKQKDEQDRLDATKEKTGVKLEGITAKNPGNGEDIPVFVADYVLGGYGTGAIMAVPAHDERDGEFARKFGLPVKQVIAPHYHLDPKPNAETLERGDVVDLIIEHPTDGTFLLESDGEENNRQIHFVRGGTEGEDHELAIERELLEETGFTDYEIVSGPYGIHTALAYRETKGKNQKAKSHFYHIKLKSLTQKSSEIEEGKHTIEWLKPEEVHNKITWIGHQFGWRAFYKNEVYTNDGLLINSLEFNDLNSEEAKEKIVEKVGGRMTSTYKIKDWVFSRQRYWGEPFPVVHLEDGTVLAVSEDQLPVTLPAVENYAPTGDGQSPLANISNWVNVDGYIDSTGDFVVAKEAPNGYELIRAKRETNTMPQWAGSSWYYLRYMDPRNETALVSKEKEKYWAPVDVYVGGDHAVRHLIYARFWHKFLYDLGVVSTAEPFHRLEFLGFILAEDGRKMSKRWGNIINPDDIVELVGADTLRIYEMFMGPFENTIAWSQDGLVGARRFLEKINGLREHIVETDSRKITTSLHKTVHKVADDIENFKFNTAISAMMIFVNCAEKEGLTKESYLKFLKLLAPFAPHLTEEIWHNLGNATSIHLEKFPEADMSLAKDDTVEIGVQINGKLRGSINVAPDATEEEVMTLVNNNSELQDKLSGATIKKIIYVPGRILNLIVDINR